MDDKELIQGLHRDAEYFQKAGCNLVADRLSSTADHLQELSDMVTLYKELDKSHQQLEQVLEQECDNLKHQVELLKVLLKDNGISLEEA